MDNYTLYVDAAYQHQQKIAVIAGILFKNGRMFDFFSIKTSNTGDDFEAFALLYGLEFAKKHTKNITVISDAERNISFFKYYQTNPTKKIVARRKKVYKAIAAEIDDFENVNLQFSKRERNKIADFLSSSNHKTGSARHFQYVEKNDDVKNSSPHNVFSQLLHLNTQEVDKKTRLHSVVSLSEITIHNGQHILNFLHIEPKSGQYYLTSKKINKKFESIPKEIFKEINSLNVSRCSNLIINGSIAENIYYAIKGYQIKGKALKTCFLELSPIWKEISNIDIFHKNGRQELKTILNNIEETYKNSPIIIKESYIDKFINFIDRIKQKIQEKSQYFQMKNKKQKP